MEDGRRRQRSPARIYCWFCGLFLALQGSTTLAARLVPSFDAAFPVLLRTTRMVPPHSLLHLATAALAFAALARGGPVPRWFSLGFGAFYVGLSLMAWASGLALGLGLQPFDHPFHLLLGGLGLLAAWRTRVVQ